MELRKVNKNSRHRRFENDILGTSKEVVKDTITQ
jgi:hypothetical protein